VSLGFNMTSRTKGYNERFTYISSSMELEKDDVIEWHTVITYWG
jgi:hypothetical protein